MRDNYNYEPRPSAGDFILVGATLAGILFIIFLIYDYVRDVRAYNASIPDRITATLLHSDYLPSTIEHHCSPGVVYHNGKAGMVMQSHTTGHSEKYVTIWDCGKYGRLKSDQEKIWQYAKPQSILLIKIWCKKPVIDDIEEV